MTLCVEHLLVDADDGRRVAFPLGATEGHEEAGGLLLSSADEAGRPVRARVTIADSALAAAIARRLAELGEGDPRAGHDPGQRQVDGSAESPSNSQM